MYGTRFALRISEQVKQLNPKGMENTNNTINGATMTNEQGLVARITRLQSAKTYEEAMGEKSVSQFWERFINAEEHGEKILQWFLDCSLNIAKGNGLQWLAELMNICDARWWLWATNSNNYADMYNDCYAEIAEYISSLPQEQQDEFYKL